MHVHTLCVRCNIQWSTYSCRVLLVHVYSYELDSFSDSTSCTIHSSQINVKQSAVNHSVTQCPLMNSHCYSMPSHEQSILSRLSSTCPNIHWLCVTSLDKDGSAIQHESHGVKAKPLKNNAPSFVMTISTDHVTTLACTYACNCFRGKSGKTNWEVQLWSKRKIHVGKCGF